VKNEDKFFGVSGEMIGSDEEGVEQIAAELKEYINEIIKNCRRGDSKGKKRVCLYSKKTGKLLGRHLSASSARNQERAIKAHGG
jgi:hypothetical protein